MAAVSRGITNLQDKQFDVVYAGSDTAPVRAPLNVLPSAQPTGTGAEGDISWNDTANGLEVFDGTQWRKLADRIIIPFSWVAASVDTSIFIADRAYKLLAVRWVTTVAGGDAGAVTGDIKKCTGTQAPSAGTTMLSATFDLKTTANTVTSSTLSSTAADLLLATGNRIAVDYTGTLTSAVGYGQIILEAV